MAEGDDDQAAAGMQNLANETSLDVDVLSKAVVAIGAFAYAIGVIAINIYLHRIGITDFSFGKPKLVLTGVLVLAAFVFLAPTPVFLVWQSERSLGADSSKRGFTWHAFLLVPVPLLLLVAGSAYLCFWRINGMGQILVGIVWDWMREMHLGNGLGRALATLIIVGFTYLPVLSTVFFAFKAWVYFHRSKSKPAKPEISFGRIGFAASLATTVLSFVVYIYVFMLTFYAAIPEAFGGGKPYFESLAIEDSEVCALRELGVPFEEERPAITEPLPVLHETDTLLAIWVQGVTKRPPPAGKKVPDGFGQNHFLVLQLDKKMINATRVFPYPRAVPEFQVAPPACVAPAGKSAP